jgi:predicted ester cyclase
MDAFFNILAPEYVEHLPTGDVSLKQLKQYAHTFFAAFPDINITVDDMVAEGNKVAVLVTWRMTHTGEFMGVPPTGKKIEMTNANIFRIAKGRIVEGWNVMDMLFLQQFGLIPKR